jgi:hypothetical protein
MHEGFVAGHWNLRRLNIAFPRITVSDVEKINVVVQNGELERMENW